MKLFGVAAGLLGLALFARADSIDCEVMSFRVTASAVNKNYSTITSDFGDLQVLTGDLTDGVYQNVPVHGTQSIVGRYCTPVRKTENSNTLQFLVHGITSNKDYWFGLEYPMGKRAKSYSWAQYMGELGYPTLAVDRLGNGQSSHPDPILEVQFPYEVELLTTLINQIKAGKTKKLPRAYANVVYVGHSLGSEIGAGIMKVHPNTFSTAVLTGFTKRVLPALPGVLLQNAVPAAVHNPKKFGHLPAGYLTAQSHVGHVNSFFGTRTGIDYTVPIGDTFYRTEDTVSVGQFVAAFTSIASADNYKGRILALTGEKDQAFCGPGSPVLGPADCGKLLPNTKTLFPKANYNYHSVAHTGHAVNLHVYRKRAFEVAHKFIQGHSFHN